MNFANFRKQVEIEVFDYQLLADHMKELKNPRDKVSALVRSGNIIRLKKGLYIFGEDWRSSPLNLELIANLIYGPSCVSFEYALNRYGLIAERSNTISSLAIGDSKTIYTPIGTFEYRAIDCDKFKIGIDYQDLDKEGGYFIASKEKALADLVYRTPGIRTVEQLRYFLFEEMRVDEVMFRNFDMKKLNEIGLIYNKNSVRMLVKL